MVQKIYKKLTEEQKARGVIFSSCLSPYKFELSDSNIHEVFRIKEEDYKDKPAWELNNAYKENEETIRRLKDDKFFNNSQYKFNIIRT